MTEPGTLELETKTAAARPHGGSPYVASAEEMEYGVTRWWIAELYLDGQATDDQSTLFTGYRVENRSGSCGANTSSTRSSILSTKTSPAPTRAFLNS